MTDHFRDDTEASKADVKQANIVRDEIHYLMRSELGRRFLKRMMVLIGRYDQSSFSTDPHMTAFLEGTRVVGLWVKTAVDDADPNYLQLVLKERFDNGSIKKQKK